METKLKTIKIFSLFFLFFSFPTDSIYFTDWKLLSLFRVDKNGRGLTTIRSINNFMMYIKIYDKDLQDSSGKVHVIFGKFCKNLISKKKRKRKKSLKTKVKNCLILFIFLLATNSKGDTLGYSCLEVTSGIFPLVSKSRCLLWDNASS